MKGRKIIEAVGKVLGKSLDEVREIKIDFANHENNDTIDLFLAKYPWIEKYYNTMLGVPIAFGVHPAGMLGSPVDLSEHIGFAWSKTKKSYYCQGDMKAVDSLNYVKYDVLGLKNVGVIADTYRYLGIDYQWSEDLDWNDKDVYEDITKSGNIGVFQFEGDYAHKMLSEFDPKSVSDITLVTACIRPSGESYRDKVMKHEKHSNPSKAIDKLLEDSLGYLVYQEQQIAFLQELCGFTGGQADETRRAIGKKDEEKMRILLPQIEQGYIDTSDRTEEDARKEIQEYLQVFIDSASYSFGYNHATAYSMVGYQCAYLRYHHPVEFITALLNNADDLSDIESATQLARVKGIEIKNPKFGVSSSEYRFEDGVIYKGIKSVLNVSEQSAIDLLSISTENKIESFYELLRASEGYPSINKTKIASLIKIDFFDMFGLAKTLEKKREIFEKYFGKKIIKKEGINRVVNKIARKFVEDKTEGWKETAKQFRFVSEDFLPELFKYLPEADYTDQEKAINQLTYLRYLQDGKLKSKTIGYIRWKSKKQSNNFNVMFTDGTNAWVKIQSDEDIEIARGQYIIIESMIKSKRDNIILSYKLIEGVKYDI